MGLFKTKKGKGQGFTFVLHVHTLSPWPANTGSLCVTYERGSKTGALRRAAAPSSPSAAGFGTVVFEEQFELPATLYGVRLPLGTTAAAAAWPAAPAPLPNLVAMLQSTPCRALLCLDLQDAAAARKGSGKAMGPFAAKELRLAVMAADARGKPSGPPLGSISLNLADYAAADGRTQQSFTLTGAGGRSLAAAGGGTPKLLLTIACRDASRSKAGGAPLIVEPSLSSLGEEEAGASGELLPTSMSTDEEGAYLGSNALLAASQLLQDITQPFAYCCHPHMPACSSLAHLCADACCCGAVQAAGRPAGATAGRPAAPSSAAAATACWRQCQKSLRRPLAGLQQQQAVHAALAGHKRRRRRQYPRLPRRPCSCSRRHQACMMWMAS
jgi:hypothetical protein